MRGSVLFDGIFIVNLFGSVKTNSGELASLVQLWWAGEKAVDESLSYLLFEVDFEKIKESII